MPRLQEFTSQNMLKTTHANLSILAGLMAQDMGLPRVPKYIVLDRIIRKEAERLARKTNRRITLSSYEPDGDR